MLEHLSAQYGLHMLAHRGDALSAIGSLTTSSDETVAVLRGEMYFAAAEEVLTRLAPLVSDDGCLVLDFSGVTRVGPAVRRLFHALPAAVGARADGSPRVVVRDPDGVLGD
jgi:glutaminase